MKRYGSVIGLRPEAIAEYKKYHAAVWPEVKEMIRKCNIRTYSIFLKDDRLFGYFEYHGTDFQADNGQDGGRSENPGMVGRRGAHAESSWNSQQG
jgi:L-rhamnose mutarotase